MKKWRLWGLGALVFIGMACRGGGITIETPPELVCGPEEELVNGRCEPRVPAEPPPLPPECRVGDGSCGESRICVGIDGGMEAGAPGRCENGCLIGEDSCAPGFECEGASEGQRGACIDKAECRVRDTQKDCRLRGNGFECEGLEGATAKGAVGECVDVAPCRIKTRGCEPADLICINEAAVPETGDAGRCVADTLGQPCSAGNDICIQGQVCDTEGTEACIYGALGEDGEIVPALSAFGLYIHEGLVVPVRTQGADVDNPHAGWVGQGRAELEVRAQGPGAHENLRVETPAGADCESPVCRVPEEDCIWRCTLPEGWAGTAERPNVVLRIGSGFAQQWTYRQSLELPEVEFVEPPQKALVGTALEVCFTATTTQAPLLSVEMETLAIVDSEGEELVGLEGWTAGVLSQGRRCWRLPAEETWALAQESSLRLNVQAKALDAAGNLAETVFYDALLKLTRESCILNVHGDLNSITNNSVNAPLAYAKGRLLFGARHSTAPVSSRLYFVDAENCKTSGNSLHTGAVQGPMVVLGDTGQVALALGGAGTGGWGPAGSTQRLAVVDVATQGFVAGSECADNSGASFNKGLALLSAPSAAAWQLAAPANAAEDAVLTAYVPSAQKAEERCVASEAIGKPIALTPVQAVETVIVHGSLLSAWNFDGEWTEEGFVDNVSTTGVWGIALGGGTSIWLSANAEPWLQLLKEGSTEMKEVEGVGNSNTSPAVIDGQGRAYVVGYQIGGGGGGSNYRLHRRNVDGSEGRSAALVVEAGGSLQMTVGSPLLGEAMEGGASELYIVTRNGRVFAFDAETLEQLWTISLGFSIVSEAQPVLVRHASGGGTLWVVGAQGQVRGIRVASEGLSQEAKWPKAFRDNCNTSSGLVTAGDMPSCF